MDSSPTEPYPLRIFNALYETVKHGRSVELEAQLSKVPSISHIFMLPCEMKEEALSLFMLAALNGHDATVRLMMKTHRGPRAWIEQSGKIRDKDGRIISNVTALWCALDRRHYDVAHTLINMGAADVNHGIKHPLLIEAIFRHRFDIVYFLVENGYADINRVTTNDHKRIHSLMAAVLAKDQQIIYYLLKRGANVHQRYGNVEDTIIHAAIRHTNLRIVELLCLTNPHEKISDAQCTSFIHAAIRQGKLDMAEFFVVCNSDEAIIEIFELDATSIVSNHTQLTPIQSEQLMRLLRFALKQRLLLNKPKKITPPVVAYCYAEECQTEQDLDSIKYDQDRLIVEALLIRERILIPRKDPSIIDPIIQRIVALCEKSHFERCLNLAFHLSHLTEQLEWPFPVEPFAAIFCQMFHLNIPIPLDRFLDVCYSASSSLRQNDNDTSYMRYIVHLIAFVGRVSPTIFTIDQVSNESRTFRCWKIRRWLRPIVTHLSNGSDTSPGRKFIRQQDKTSCI